MIVKKYGGSALATPEQILNIAKKVAEDYKKNPEPTIVVVSAMGQTTNDLLQLGHSISPLAPARELDMLVSAGERISMALMSIALQKNGCPAISFTGSQAGIMTTSKHGQAFIQEVKPIRVDQELAKNKIIVIAGFQGVDPITKEVTTLGRGGTDTTAVAFSAHYKARSCELYKDVPGVLCASPQILPGACLVKEITYEDLTSLCYWGSKVVHHRAVELAKVYNVPLKIGSWKDHKIGTSVVVRCEPTKNQKENKMELVKINHLSVFEPILTVSYTCPLEQAVLSLTQTAQDLDLPFPSLIASTSTADEKSRLMLTGHQDWVGKLFEGLQRSQDVENIMQDHFGLVLQGQGLENGFTMVDLVASMKESKIQINKIIKEPQGFIYSFHQSEKQKVLDFIKTSKTLSHLKTDS